MFARKTPARNAIACEAGKQKPNELQFKISHWLILNLLGGEVFYGFIV